MLNIETLHVLYRFSEMQKTITYDAHDKQENRILSKGIFSIVTT